MLVSDGDCRNGIVLPSHRIIAQPTQLNPEICAVGDDESQVF
jgi:hypothetical protein